MPERGAERTLADLEDRLAADLADMKRLHDTSTRLLRETDLDTLLHEILVAAIAITRADMGNLQMLDPEAGHLRIRRQIGFERAFLDFFDSVDAGEAACGTAWREGARVVVPDVEASPLFAGTPALEVMLRAGARAVQSTPLVSRSGRLLGMISTHYRKPHRPEDRELRMLDLLARQAADLIERAESEEALRRSRLELQHVTAGLEREVSRRTAQLERQTVRLRRLAAELTRVEQHDRRRLAGQVHDHLQQLLVAARLRLARIQRGATDPDLRRELSGVQDLTGEALRAAASITAELRPPILHNEGLIAALQWLRNDVLDRYGLDVRLEADEPVGLSEAIETLLFECVREAVSNVRKHAGVDSAAITVVRNGDWMKVAVEDRGRGFDPGRLDEVQAEIEDGSARFGLFSIAERLAAVGGALRIESAPGEGTRLEMRAPLGPALEPRRSRGRGDPGP